MTIEEVCGRIDRDSPKIIEDLRRLVRQPSISAQGVGLRECASLVMEMMVGAGLKAEILETDGAPPFVYGEMPSGQPGEKKTVIFYNHYDVQPPEPLELWSSDPFAAEIREGKMFGRGVSDNKADIVSREFFAPLKVHFYYDGFARIACLIWLHASTRAFACSSIS